MTEGVISRFHGADGILFKEADNRGVFFYKSFGILQLYKKNQLAAVCERAVIISRKGFCHSGFAAAEGYDIIVAVGWLTLGRC